MVLPGRRLAGEGTSLRLCREGVLPHASSPVSWDGRAVQLLQPCVASIPLPSTKLCPWNEPYSVAV